jgi:hypothetical protein
MTFIASDSKSYQSAFAPKEIVYVATTAASAPPTAPSAVQTNQVNVANAVSDLIILRNGDRINAKVIEITTSEIKYKRFEHLDGPTIAIPRSEVFSITYENGKYEVIKAITQQDEEAERNSLKPQQGDKAIGGNLIMGDGFGIGGKFQYNVSAPIRLAGEFDFFPSSGASRMDISMYGHCLISLGKRVLIYPSVGIGMTDITNPNRVFNFSLSGGIDIALSSNMVLISRQ